MAEKGIWGCFGQYGDGPMGFCPNLGSLQTKWRWSGGFLSELGVTSDKMYPLQ
ncbi:hypothetical protein [Bacillus sp. ISL-45]|uniref:hypothetical protein n=1 Tax=Bacillus sp. ISL-45 TaxID=2819128 RepID=UPI001BEBEF84|nr:hypothetical protein [Bacillus sp. ISL-45]MBT2662843.1 hypothetical protein [Bacillus sp. ISL-45]